MKDLIILGAGGLGKEIAWLVEEINDSKKEWNILGFLDSHPAVQHQVFLNYPVLGFFEDYINYIESYFVVAFGDPRYRKEVVEILKNHNVNWANLISPTVRIHKSNKLGKGVVIGRYADITVECELSDHVMLNIHTVIGHKVKIGDYSIISPNVTINGGAIIGKCCSIGANTFIRDIKIGDEVTVGASSCVVKDVGDNCVVAGVPAKVIREGAPLNKVTTSLRVTK